MACSRLLDSLSGMALPSMRQFEGGFGKCRGAFEVWRVFGWLLRDAYVAVLLSAFEVCGAAQGLEGGLAPAAGEQQRGVSSSALRLKAHITTHNSTNGRLSASAPRARRALSASPWPGTAPAASLALTTMAAC